MSRLPLPPESGGGRFPGFDVMAQAPHWDPATVAVVAARLGRAPSTRFFTLQEEATAAALLDQLLDQRSEPRVPVVQLIDARLVHGATDGWHYEDMPEDAQAWRDSLAALDAEARDRAARDFADLAWDAQATLLQDVLDRGRDRWRGFVAAHVWSLWTRYACTAFYSHPKVWDEIGFSGPAYPRGYKNIGVDRREPFEVPDHHPADDPVREGC